MITYKQVQNALSVLYCLGYKEIGVTEFITLLKYDERINEEVIDEERVKSILKMLEKQNKTKITNEKIKLLKTWGVIPSIILENRE